jgi:hypothetical protein
MNSRYPYMLVVAVIFVFCMTTFMASLAEARGRGRGGGGMRQPGPTGMGHFSRPRSALIRLSR